MTGSALAFSHLIFFGAVLALAACFALLEIQIEGRDGWAAKLPTWTFENRWWTRVFPGRPLTGYHLYVLLFIALVAHLPFVFGLPWSKLEEFRVLSFVLFFWVAEDFLWFVLNPHFGLRRFRPQFIAWHRASWWWIAPRDYWLALSLATCLYAFSQHEPVIYVALRP